MKNACHGPRYFSAVSPAVSPSHQPSPLPRAFGQFGLLATLSLAMGLAHGASYQLSASPYVSVSNFTPPCASGSCGSYTLAMSPGGWFTYSGTLPANLVAHELATDPNLVDFSFSDGLQTFSRLDPGTRLTRFQIWTNALGQVTQHWLAVDQWQDNGAGPHSPGERMHSLNLTSGLSTSSLHNRRCGSLGVSAVGVADSCLVLSPDDASTSTATFDGSAAWSAVPSLSINDVSINEGNSGTTLLTFTVSLDQAPTAPVSVEAQVLPGTATAGVDYTAVTPVTLNWAAGDASSRPVSVSAFGDTAWEPDETLTVRLTNAQGAGMVKATGTGTLLNDDSAVELALSYSDLGATTTPGGSLSYQASCTNSGTAAATGVTLTAAVPANTRFNAAASSPGWTCAPNNLAGATCTLALGTLNSGGNQVAQFALTVDSPLAESVVQITSNASCQDDGSHGADLNVANNSATDNTPVNHPQVPPIQGDVPNQTGTVGVPFSLDLSAWVTPTNGDPILAYQLRSGTLPPGLTVNAATGLLAGTPLAAGSFDISVGAQDNDGPSTADALRITIAAAPVPPAPPAPPAPLAPVPGLSSWATLLLAGHLALLAAFARRRHPRA